jgi:pimeloyl-ACP methyl ester carboxylesterase
MDTQTPSRQRLGRSVGTSGPDLLELIANSPRMPLREDDAAQLSAMESLSFGHGAERRAWSVGAGPFIMLVHGWGGIGAQMAPLALALAAAGFRCVLFDALGHGQSAEGKVGFDTFANDTAALCDHLGASPKTMIGHSAGALGMMAARYRHGLSAEHYMCLAMPLFPYVPLETLKRKYDLEDRQLLPLKPLLAAQFRRSWAQLEAGCVFTDNPQGQLTLIYDRADPRVRHEDADKIASLWPDAKIIKTDGLGHNRILRDPRVIAAVKTLLAGSDTTNHDDRRI